MSIFILFESVGVLFEGAFSLWVPLRSNLWSKYPADMISFNEYKANIGIFRYSSTDLELLHLKIPKTKILTEDLDSYLPLTRTIDDVKLFFHFPLFNNRKHFFINIIIYLKLIMSKWVGEPPTFLLAFEIKLELLVTLSPWSHKKISNIKNSAKYFVYTSVLMRFKK